MTAQRVVVTDHLFPHVDRERAAAEAAAATFVAGASGESLMSQAAGANVLVVNLEKITADVLRELAPGAVVIRYGIGYDNIDVDAARELGVSVAATTGYGSETVADHAAALLLSLMRRIPEFAGEVRDGRWSSLDSRSPFVSFSRSTVGLLGTGRIGSALIERLAPFGFSLIAFDPYVDPAVMNKRGVRLVSLEELFATSDALSLHAPLTPETHHVVNAASLATMKPGAVLVNTSRGALIDTDALVEALQHGNLSAAGLDVFEQEPLRADSPLRTMRSVVATPHIGWYSDLSIDRLQELVAEQISRALTGTPLEGLVTG